MNDGEDVTELRVQENTMSGIISTSLRCDSCFQENETLIAAQFMCFDCELYFCVDCLPRHAYHRQISRSHDSVDIDRVLRDVSVEVEIARKFMRESGQVIGRIKVKHSQFETDDCSITGICVLRDKRVAVCDYNNLCIKMYSSKRYKLKRYFRLLSQPWDIAEIHSRTNSGVMLHERHVSKTETKEQGEKGQGNNSTFQLAFSSMYNKQVVIISVNDRGCSITQVIKINGCCSGIVVQGDKILTVFENEKRDSTLSVAVHYINGVPLQVIFTDIRGTNAYLTISPQADFFIVSRYRDIIQRVTLAGEILEEYSEEGWCPEGVCIGECESVYACAKYKNAICKLSWDLRHCFTLTDSVNANIPCPMAIGSYNNTIIISHMTRSKFTNYLTVIQVV